MFCTEVSEVGEVRGLGQISDDIRNVEFSIFLLRRYGTIGVVLFLNRASGTAFSMVSFLVFSPGAGPVPYLKAARHHTKVTPPDPSTGQFVFVP